MSDLPPLQASATVQALFGGRAMPADANAGLVFDRYLRIWSGGVAAPAKSKEVAQDLRAFVEQFNRRSEAEEHTALLAQHNQRIAKLAAPDGEHVFRTTFRLATGLGQQHPLENGFVFDPVVGVPYLPGSSVKGLLRAYWERHADDTSDLAEMLGEGPASSGGTVATARAGQLVVLPALPRVWPKLAVDVINCHHPAYYASAGRADPVDWENPNPVYFLAVDAGVDFVFRLGWRRLGAKDPARDERAPERLKRAFEHLEQALDVLGIGAKTAVGYGVMTRPDAPKRGGTPRSGSRGGAGTGGGQAAPVPAEIDAAAIANLLRTVDKNNASARVPEVLKQVPADKRATVAREILKKLDRKWVLARKDKSWAAELLGLVEGA